MIPVEMEARVKISSTAISVPVAKVTQESSAIQVK